MAIRYPKPDPDVAMRLIVNVLRARLWAKQEAIVRAVFSHKITVVKSCHSSGKTYVAAAIALAWLFTGPKRVVVTSAPTMRQIKELLWQEIRDFYRQADACGTPLGGRLMPSACELHIGDKWKAIGFSSDNPINMQGHHSPGGVLVILDEAMGVEPEVWSALNGVLTADADRLLAIGNPTVAEGPFYDFFDDADPSVAKITISAHDLPNVIAGREVIPGMVGRAWVEMMARKFGVHSDHYRSRVLGEFPIHGDNQLIPQAWVDAAFARHDAVASWMGPVRFGVDVARYGPDSSVIADSYPVGVRDVQVLPKVSTTETAGITMRTARLHPGDVVEVRVDSDGLGGGVYDRMEEEQLPYVITEMRGGQSAMSPEDFQNRRSEWFWQLREDLDPDGPRPIALPRDEVLKKELCGIRWRTLPKGQVAVESKEDMRKRGLHSPDKADAVAYARARLEHDVPTVSVDPTVGHAHHPVTTL